MSIYRHNRKTGKAENTISTRGGKNQRTWIHALAVMLFCMVLSIGTIVFADEVPATVIVAGAKIRALADTSSEALAGVKSGDTLSICGQTTGADGNVWYQVYVDSNTKGFIRSDLIQKKTDGSIATVSNSNSNTTTTTTTNADTTETSVTPVESRNGTVVTNNVRIRKGASTKHDVVATANKGMVLTVTGEAAGADGKTWYQVSFSYNNKAITGFIRSDLVTFDSVSPDTAVSEITGTEETPEETTTEAVSEEIPQEPVEEEAKQEPQDENANMILMNVEEEVYVLPEFTEIVLKWQDQDIKAFKNGQFYLFYAQKQNGETGWFLYDSENGVYQRYVYDTADATVPEGSTLGASPFLLIILGVVIVILIAIIGLMFIKLREYTSEYYDDEYDDDEDDEDENYEEELEEEELEEEEEPIVQQPVRRPERPQQRSGQQMVRRPERPQSQQGNVQPQRRPERPQQSNHGQQPVRRPERPQQESGEPIRRPERPQSYQGSGQQPQRRPERPQQENGQQPQRHPERPQQQGNTQPQRRQPGEPQQKRPTKQQNRPVKGTSVQQSGHKAKNFLDSEDDDMEFIDI